MPVVVLRTICLLRRTGARKTLFVPGGSQDLTVNCEYVVVEALKGRSWDVAELR